MSNLTFLDLQTEVCQQTGLDITDATVLTNVKRWINFVQQDICARWPWTFLLGREAIATIADYSTGTVSVAAGGTAVTGVGTTFTTTHGDGTYFIQFTANNDYYRVSARGSNTTLTLETAYQGTAVSGGAFTLRKFFYSLSSTADEVIDVRNWNTPLKLIQCDFRTIDLINPLAESSSPGYAYMMFGTDSSGNLVYTPYPFPNDTRLFEFRVRKRPTDMSANGDFPSIPNKYAHLLAFGATALGFAYERNFQAAEEWNAKLEGRLMGMKKEYQQSGDYQPMLSSIDRVNRSNWIPLPSNYPVIQG
jgi:hypothetical protein